MVLLNWPKKLWNTDILRLLVDESWFSLYWSKAPIPSKKKCIVPNEFRFKERVPPFHIRAHFTRDGGVSWAFWHQTTVSQICKTSL